jgi:hypothetical protein
MDGAHPENLAGAAETDLYAPRGAELPNSGNLSIFRNFCKAL